MNNESFLNQSISGTLLKTETESNVPHSEKRKITITLRAYQHIETFFPICDIHTECIYNNQEIGSSPPIPITDNEVLSIDYSCILEVDVASTEELDKLISSPGCIKVILTSGAYDREIYEQLVLNPEFISPKPKPLESVISIYEAFNEEKLEASLPESRQSTRKSILKNDKSKLVRIKRDKSISDRKTMRISSISNKMESNIEFKHVEHESHYIKKTMLYGQSTIDFIPFFYGKTSFEETLLIKQVQELDDDCMKPFKHCPKIIISLSIDQPLTIKHSLIMHFSLESVYNFPHADEADLEMQVCWVLPKSDDSYCSPIVISNPIQTNEKPTKRVQFFWPNMKKDATICTKYWLNNATDDIKSISIENVDRYLQGDVFRLEFNVIKRNIFFQDGKIAIQQMFKVFKNILLEIEIVLKSKKKISLETQMLPTHFMAVVDVSGLLYPGARKTRVAAPLKTFCLLEAKEICGLGNSYFRPEEINEHQSLASITRSLNHEKKAQRERSARSLRRSLKNESVQFESTTKKSFVEDAQKRLPETSLAVYDETGKPCILVVNIELSEPINAIREIEDLSNKLKEILKKKIHHNTDKIVLTPTVAKDYYTEVLNEIISDLNKKFIRFIKENPKCNMKSDTQIRTDFVKFLQKIGSYKLYLNSISKAISIVATTDPKFKNFNDTDPEGSSQDFIGELFCYLISKMHDTVNGLICNSSQPAMESGDDSKELFIYAKEAAELGQTQLANRYFLERLTFNQNNVDYWFDYSVFFLELNDIDGALECIRKALLLKHNHRYSLMSFGIIMVMKSQMEEAETALLYLMANESKWTEGWGVLYIFYHTVNDSVGMGWALEMAKKNLHNTYEDDYFSKFEDLAWSLKEYPNRIFLRTATLLIKIRLFQWAEMACAQELHANTEVVKELLAAICFYRGNFQFAENYLLELKSGGTWNDSLTALSGHCLFGQQKLKDAKDDYYSLLKSENCNTNLHLVYIKCAKIMEDLGDTQEARKLILLACKYSPTPYTLLRAAQLYYLQHDLLSAEECLTAANSLDNRYADIWGYLTLINLKMLRFDEAELCYNQAIKRDMHDKDLIQNIEAERIKHNLLN